MAHDDGPTLYHRDYRANIVDIYNRSADISVVDKDPSYLIKAAQKAVFCWSSYLLTIVKVYDKIIM